MGTQANIAQTIRHKKADYVLAVKNNQPRLAETISDFFTQFRPASPAMTPHSFHEQIEKDHGRIEHRRCFAFDQLDCLHNPEQWPDLKAFVVIDSERTLKGKTSREQRYYITSLPPDAQRLAHAIRSHWAVENAAHNLAVFKHMTVNLIRLDPLPRKGGIKVRRFIASTSDLYRSHLFDMGE